MPLAEHLLARLIAVHGRAEVHLTPEAERLLESFSWPGNVRQLKNAIEHAIVFSKNNELGPADFPGILTAGAAGAGMRSLEELEREQIAATLDATHYKIARAAEILGISRKTLLEKRKKYGLL